MVRIPELTVVMPAFNEQANLVATVADFMDTLSASGIDYRIIVVNDGSEDATGTVADDIGFLNPERFKAVHHATNQGYGSAVRTGIKAALDTGSQWILLTDSDGQFKAEQAADFLDAARTQRSSLVIGYRHHRADPWPRKVSAKVWTTMNRLLNGVKVRDVDCAYKLIHRSTLQKLVLHGEAAAISPELVAKAKATGANVIELPANHYPRLHGEQTGNELPVILKSLAGMFILFRELFAGRHRLSALHPLVYARDVALRRVTVLATLLSVIAATFVAMHGQTLAYPDALSHELIARRVVSSPTGGFGQLGGVWLPLTHVLMLPLVWNDWLFYSGWAGTVVSMAAFVLGCRYLFRIGREFRNSWVMGAVGASVFALNPNVLYMQSTPMTEVPLIAGMAASMYYLQRWCKSGEWWYLTFSSVAVMLACLVRYEAWVFLMGELAVFCYVAARKHRTWSQPGRGNASLLFFAFLAIAAIPGWMIWNALIFRDPLFFLTGEYAKPSLWVDRSDKAIGNLSVAARTYGYAVYDNLGTVILGLFLVGLLYFVGHSRLRPEEVAPLSLLSLAPFFVYALYAGQRPMHVEQIGGDLYNVRFGLVQILPAAVFISYLAGSIIRNSSRLKVLVLALFIALAGASVPIMGATATLKEAVAFSNTPNELRNQEVAGWLNDHYDGGKILMESFGNETVTFGSRLPTKSIIYEGTNARGEEWAKALLDPQAYGVRWIYMRTTPGNEDRVSSELGSARFLARYELVFEDKNRRVYRSKRTLTEAERATSTIEAR